MSRMSMLTRGVLCLLVVVFYCAGVANAESNNDEIVQLAKESHSLDVKADEAATQTSKAIEECTDAEKAADETRGEADAFVREIEGILKAVEGKELETLKQKVSEGVRLVQKAKAVAMKAREAVNKTKAIMTPTAVKGKAALEASRKFYERYKQEIEKRKQDSSCQTLTEEVEKVYPNFTKMEVSEVGQRAIDVAHDAIGETVGPQLAAKDVEDSATHLEAAIKILEAAVATAEGSTKQQTSQQDGNPVQSLTGTRAQDPSVEDSQSQSAEGETRVGTEEGRESSVRTETNEAQSSSSSSDAANTGENDTHAPMENAAPAKTILNNTAHMKKIKEKNGSSNPAVLRVPLLLLLLLPVLGCMAVC